MHLNLFTRVGLSKKTYRLTRGQCVSVKEPVNPVALASLSSPAEIQREISCCDRLGDSRVTGQPDLGSAVVDPQVETKNSVVGPKVTSSEGQPSKEDEKSGSGAAQQSCSDPPDGGYGWIIALGAFMVQFWVAGLTKSYGVIYLEVLQVFPNTSAALASWIPAMLTTLTLFFAPVSGILCQKFTCRAVVFVGGLCCFLGISLSYFATSLLQLFLSFGVLTGIGAGLSITPGIVIISQYFSKRRAFANGICLSGTAAGSMVLPPLIELLLPEFGFRGTVLILGACMLHVCLSAILYRPIAVHQRITEQDRRRIRQVSSGSLPAELKEKQGKLSPTWVRDAAQRKVEAKPASGRRYIDLSLLKNPLFLLTTLSSMLMSSGCPHMLIFLPSHLTSLGFSKTDAGILISVSAVGDLIGRIFFGILADLKFFSKCKGYVFCILCGGLAVLCLPLVSSYGLMIAVVSAYGFGFGGWFLLIPVLLSEYHGNERIASSYGLLRLCQAVVTLAVPPLSGFLKDLTGSFASTFYVMGAAMTSASLLMVILEPFLRRQQERKDATSSQTAASA